MDNLNINPEVTNVTEDVVTATTSGWSFDGPSFGIGVGAGIGGFCIVNKIMTIRKNKKATKKMLEVANQAAITDGFKEVTDPEEIKKLQESEEA